MEERKAWKIVPLNFPRASDTPRDGGPTSAPETPRNVLPKHPTAHFEEEDFQRIVSPARALRLGNMVARGSVLGGTEGALDLSTLEPEYLELLRQAQGYLNRSGDRHSEPLLIGEDKRKEDPHKRERDSSASEGSNSPPPLKRIVEELPTIGMDRDAPTSSAPVLPSSHQHQGAFRPLEQDQAHGTGPRGLGQVVAPLQHARRSAGRAGNRATLLSVTPTANLPNRQPSVMLGP